MLAYGSNVYANPAPEINCEANPPNAVNWSGCKIERDLAAQDLDFGIFHNTNFESSNLFKANLNYSDLTGAKFKITNLNQASLSHAIWVDGQMCKLGSTSSCKAMTLDETYQKLYELYQDALTEDAYDSGGFARYFRIVAQHSINQVLPNFINKFATVVKRYPHINTEDPIDYVEFNDDDKIILLEYDKQKLVAFRVDSFQDYINNPHFSLRNLVGGMLRLRK